MGVRPAIVTAVEYGIVYPLSGAPAAAGLRRMGRTRICSLSRMQMDIADLEVIQHRKHWK
jgi:hypothetical protein